MSWRIWLGETVEPWAEENLCEYPSLEALCDRSWYQRPIKAYAPEPGIMVRYLDTMERNWGVAEDEFSDIRIGTPNHWTDWEVIKKSMFILKVPDAEVE